MVASWVGRTCTGGAAGLLELSGGAEAALVVVRGEGGGEAILRVWRWAWGSRESKRGKGRRNWGGGEEIRSCGTKRCFGGDGRGRRGLVLFGLFAWGFLLKYGVAGA